MPSQSEADRALTLDGLIKEAQLINGYTAPFELFAAVPEAQTLSEYKKWCGTVRDFFAKSKDIAHYLPDDFFLAERIDLPHQTLEKIGMPSEEYRTRLREFRKELSSAIASQINLLLNTRERLLSQSMPVTIHLEKDGSLWRQPRRKYFHQGRVSSKRIKLLLLLQKSGGSVKTETLVKKLQYSSPQLLAQEKRKMNHSRLEAGCILCALKCLGRKIHDSEVVTAFLEVFVLILDVGHDRLVSDRT